MAEHRSRARAEPWISDLRFALRSLRRAPGFSLSVVVTLAVGIGVATAVFNLTAWLLFFASPFPQASELVMVGFKDPRTPFVPVRSGLHFEAFQEQTDVFSAYAAVRREMSNVVIDGEPTAVEVLGVSAETFSVFGLQPVRGRGFRPEEMRPGSDTVVVISDLFWRRQFNAASDVLGRSVDINQRPYVVVGVMGANQRYPLGFKGDVYRPLVFKTDPQNLFDPMLHIVGRLKRGVSLAQAQAALIPVKLPPLPQWASTYLSEQETKLMPLTEVGGRTNSWVLFTAAMLLFGMACLNAMNLMLVRLLARGREFSIRLALGGTRWQLSRLVVIESLVLAAGAMLLVAAMTRWLFPPLFALIHQDAAERYATYWNWGNLGFITGLGVLATVVVALLPILRLSGKNVNDQLKSGGAGSGESRGLGTVRNTLVVAQAALAVILLAGTGLMMRTFQRLHQVDLGFDPAGKVKVYVGFPRGSEPKPAERLQYFERLRATVAKLPGVIDASATQDTLVVGDFYGTAQLKMKDGSYRPVMGGFVPADLQQTAGLTMVRGRWLSGKRGAAEAVINETMARERFGDDDPVGQSFTLQVSGDRPYLVVGVVRDIRQRVRLKAGMQFYTPDWMYPPNVSSLLLRLAEDPPKEFVPVIRRAVYAFDPNLIVVHVASLHELVASTMEAERTTYTLLRGLAAIALGLAVVGLFSVIAYTVQARTREFGLRLALGATPGNLHRLVLRRGVVTAALGILVGVAGALLLTRFMQSLLFETAPYDPVVYLAVAGLLLLATLLACWLPARRAAKVEPMVALRAD